jgi:hypothetical protein
MAVRQVALQWRRGNRFKEVPFMPSTRSPSSYRLSDEALDLIDKLAGILGVSKTSVLEMAIRQLARREMNYEAQPKKPDGRRKKGGQQ